MDPLSSVASVVTLAGQLGKNAIKIKRFLDTVSNAPSEVIRLKHIISQIDSITHLTTQLRAEQGSLHRQDTCLWNSVCCSLKRCQTSLNSIVEDASRRADHDTRKSASVSRRIANFGLACKRQQIKGLEEDLSHAIQIITLCLLMHMIDSNALITSFIADAKPTSLLALQQQLPPADTLACIQSDVSYAAPSQQPATINAVSPDPISLLKPYASIAKRQSRDSDVKHQRKHQAYSYSFRIKICRSYVLVARISSPWTISTSIPVAITIRHIVAEDAAIIQACKDNDCRKVKELLDTGKAAPDDTTPSNKTPLCIAIKIGSEELVGHLLFRGADKNLPCGQFETSPAQTAVAYERPSIIRTLVQYDADLDYNSTRGWSLLHHLFASDRSTASSQYILFLIDQLPFHDTRDSEGWSSLHRCAAFGTSQDVQLLRLMGASMRPEKYVTHRGWSPLHVAALWNNVSTLEAFAQLGRTERIQGLSDTEGGILNSTDYRGWTPMHLAAFGQAKDTMRWLIRSGADPYRKTYATAPWFPTGHEGETFTVRDLATLSGPDVLSYFIKDLDEFGYDITVDGEDVFWPAGDS